MIYVMVALTPLFVEVLRQVAKIVVTAMIVKNSKKLSDKKVQAICRMMQNKKLP